MMRPTKQFFILFSLVLTLAASAKQTTLNNGNLVMQNMPAIPVEIKAELN